MWTDQQKMAIESKVKAAVEAQNQLFDALGEIEEEMGFMISDLDNYINEMAAGGGVDLEHFLQFAEDNRDGDIDDDDDDDEESE